MTRTLCRAWLLGVALFAAGAAATPARTVRVAVVTDGPLAHAPFPVEAIERQVTEIAADDLRIELPAEKRLVADWTPAGVDAALGRALADPEVDVVLALGVLASHQAAHRRAPERPLIAPIVLDPRLQEFPLAEGRSGRRNFTYAADFGGIDAEVREFHRVTGFHHLAALIDDALIAALPTLEGVAERLRRELGVRITLLATGRDAAAALAAIPVDADAAFVASLRLDAAGLAALTRGLEARRLPSFSAIGRSDLDAGLMLTTGGAQGDVDRLARRVVLMIQRLAAGEAAADIEVGFAHQRRLVINMRAAQAVGFSPRWQDLTDAEQLHAAAASGRQALTLAETLAAALRDSPALAASRARTASSADDERIARARLLPALDAALNRTRIDADRASPLTQAEETAGAELTLTTPLYSERAWANRSIAGSLAEAARHAEREELLDTLESAANAYFSLLRADAAEAVRRGNVDNTRKNLETSRVREAVGLAEHSDYLRWVSRLARDKQELLGAEAARRQAETELARVIHRPIDAGFAVDAAGLDGPIDFVASPRTQAFIDTPRKWAAFTAYAVETALERSAEIAQAEAAIASRRRAAAAAKRAYWLPEFALVAKSGRALDERGAGATAVPGAPDDESWSVTLQASLPLFTGGRRRAERSQALNELDAAEADGDAARDAVEARIRAALHRSAGSYPAIALSRTAATAAEENLAMVTEAYARGAVSVTELIDAQDAALEAGLGMVDAKHGFLSDFVAVLRALDEFDLLLQPEAREQWLERVERWINERVGEMPAPRR